MKSSNLTTHVGIQWSLCWSEAHRAVNAVLSAISDGLPNAEMFMLAGRRTLLMKTRLPHVESTGCAGDSNAISVSTSPFSLRGGRNKHPMRNIAIVILLLFGVFPQEVSAIQIGPKLPKCGGFICDKIEEVKNETIKKPAEKLIETPLKSVLKNAEELLKKISRGACIGPYQSITQPIIAGCANYAGRMRKRDLINQAKDLLIQKGYFVKNDFGGVKIRWCPLKGDTAGMVPDRDKLLLNTTYINDSARDLAPVIAHEMVHVKQYIKMGTDKFKCKYTEKFLRCACQDENHSLEREAYEFEEKVRSNL